MLLNKEKGGKEQEKRRRNKRIRYKKKNYNARIRLIYKIEIKKQTDTFLRDSAMWFLANSHVFFFLSLSLYLSVYVVFVH